MPVVSGYVEMFKFLLGLSFPGREMELPGQARTDSGGLAGDNRVLRVSRGLITALARTAPDPLRLVVAFLACAATAWPAGVL
jgi:hypothetical protein